MNLKPGARLRSAVCETEVVVVRAQAGDVDLRCGGTAMRAASDAQEPPTSMDPAFADGTLLGKRYEKSGAVLEVLCVRGGAGSLSLGAEPLQQMGPRKLPASD